MISDVLWEAIRKIEDYQRTMPDAYDDIKPEIEEVKAKMLALQVKLDTPPEV